MKLPKVPALDSADRRIVGMALVLVLTFLAICLTVGAGLGLGVRAFWILAGGV